MLLDTSRFSESSNLCIDCEKRIGILECNCCSENRCFYCAKVHKEEPNYAEVKKRLVEQMKKE